MHGDSFRQACALFMVWSSKVIHVSLWCSQSALLLALKTCFKAGSSVWTSTDMSVVDLLDHNFNKMNKKTQWFITDYFFIRFVIIRKDLKTRVMGKGGIAVQGLALSPHSKKVLGSNCLWIQTLSHLCEVCIFMQVFAYSKKKKKNNM